MREGAGVRRLLDNLADIYENDLPENPADRTAAITIFGDLLDGLAATTDHLPSNATNRMGNEILIDIAPDNR